MPPVRGRVVALRALVFGLLAAWLMALPAPALAFSCPPPTPWYIQTIELAPPTLPAEVRVWAAPDDAGRTSIYLKNTTQDPLYLLGLRPVVLERELPNIAVGGVVPPSGMVELDQIFPTRRLLL